MNMKIGDKVLITTDNWFFAPDGEMYRAVWGTVNRILNDEQALGIKTNARSTNWFVSIGDMVVAGCQIHYAIKADKFSDTPPTREVEHNGEISFLRQNMTRIYNANN